MHKWQKLGFTVTSIGSASVCVAESGKATVWCYSVCLSRMTSSLNIARDCKAVIGWCVISVVERYFVTEEHAAIGSWITPYWLFDAASVRFGPYGRADAPTYLLSSV